MPFECIGKKLAIENKSGKVSVKQNCETNITGVFAGGDAVNGGKEVVDAVQAGKDGAKGIVQYLGLNK